MQSHPVQHSKVKCAEAVALVQDGRYKAAARRFTEVRPTAAPPPHHSLSAPSSNSGPCCDRPEI